MNNVAAVSGPRRLADFLRERRGAILDRWEAAVRQLRPAQRLRRPALLDHIPQFLEELENFVGDLREHRPAAPPEDVPRIHAVERLEMGYELADVVEEYSILRACIIEMAAEERAPAVRSNELPRLHRAIDPAIAPSVQRYQQAASEQRRQLGDQLIGAVAINTDITERIRQERGLREALEVSERLGGVLAHDLRNPLGVISTSASLLQREALEMRHARIVGRISCSAERIDRMIHDLLDYTRAQKGGGLPANPRPMDLADTCRLVAEESELLFSGSKVQVSVEGNPRGEWDPDRIYQAVSNLVVNAVRHGAPNLPVKIAVRGADRDVTVSVHNDGPAIPLEAVGTIFEPFQCGPSAGTSRSGGLGLGLYIVRQIALAHGGTVEMTSDDAVGTTFFLRLPGKR